MRSVRRRTALAVAALAVPAALAAPAAALFLFPTATAGHTASDTIEVAVIGGEQLAFHMDEGGDHEVHLVPTGTGRRIAAGSGCTPLPLTIALNQGVRCKAGALAVLRVTLGPQTDRYLHSFGSTEFMAIDVQLGAGGGPDVITTREGEDVIDGGPGDDQIRTDGGADRVVGGGGRDTIDTGPGDDIINALDGLDPDREDTVTCGTGFDRVTAEARDVVAADCESVVRRG